VTVTYRPPLPSELTECALVWYTAVDDYMARLGRPLPSPYLDPLLTLLAHLMKTDPQRFLVAVRSARPASIDGGGQIVGFAIAAQREHVWFLSQLYVLPSDQGKGIGRALLNQVLPSLDPPVEEAAADGPADSAPTEDTALPRRPGVLATCTDSAQPISNGLYARLGVVPRLPVFNLVGTPNPSGLSRLPAGVEATPFGSGDPTPAIDAVDRAVIGYAHASDHAYLRATGRTGFIYRTANGELLGYGYSSEAGRFGPVALLDETLTSGLVAPRPHGSRDPTIGRWWPSCGPASE